MAEIRMPEELYLVLFNLIIKTEIIRGLVMQQMRKDSIANQLRMLTHSGTTNTQRYLLNEMTDVFSSLFTFLSNRYRFNEALQVVESIPGSGGGRSFGTSRFSGLSCSDA